MQRETTAPCDLLDDAGRIIQEGWARRPFWRYDRSRVRASRFRIKEWDYYAVISPRERAGVTVTYSDLGYAGLYALCWVDLAAGVVAQYDVVVPFTLHRSGLSADPDHADLHLTRRDLTLHLTASEGVRRLTVAAPNLTLPDGSQGVTAEISLDQPSALESMNIATSWAENRRAFYYNRKINCMPASGTISAGRRHVELDADEAMGTLDWGRGRWTYDNTWYWASFSGRADGVAVGCNLGYGFSDRSPATENTILHGSTIHKLGEVSFLFDPGDLLRSWRFVDDAGRLDLTMEPAVDREGDFNLGIIASRQHQVFGWFSGRLVLDDGSEVFLDAVPGFAEEVKNRW